MEFGMESGPVVPRLRETWACKAEAGREELVRRVPAGRAGKGSPWEPQSLEPKPADVVLELIVNEQVLVV